SGRRGTQSTYPMFCNPVTAHLGGRAGGLPGPSGSTMRSVLAAAPDRAASEARPVRAQRRGSMVNRIVAGAGGSGAAAVWGHPDCRAGRLTDVAILHVR